ncbi:M48 family metallopeptidase [Thioalkalivibrio paradoxus]|uniref:Peptidase M48 Ste24p n=1 Tax=Thioalkalivibrio paradoxus ARh 1 TaxID=713585 RepID=W0DLY8_9GAMM|nr:M48 family metallopeptidase [Thioalkalivibrio paradoxus]AHE99604.1 peptidase M48 Ste24p [Thioalkalivibrio paradoxus ARh 1]
MKPSPSAPPRSRRILSFGATLVALATVAALLVACTANPVTGRSQLMLVSESAAISASRQAYTEMLAPAREEGRVDSDPRTKQRVLRISERVVAQAVRYRPDTADWDWQIAVIDAPDTINAFAMAGGKMAIYTGIIDQLDLNDDELAQIIGHEIAHALSAHSAEKMSVALASNLALATYAATGTRSDVALTGAALAAMVAIQLPNSRQMEAEADRIGIEIAARAGYRPEAAASLWAKMADQAGARHPVFLSTHPAPESRQRDLAALASQMQPLYQQARRGPLPTHPVR